MDIHRLASLDRSRVDAADGDPANVLAPIQRRDHHLKIRFGIDGWTRQMVNQKVQQRTHVFSGFGWIVSRVAFFRTGKNVSRTVELFFSTKIGQQFESFIESFGRTAVGAVYFVHYNDWFDAGLQCFFEHEPSLWHRAFRGIDQHQCTIGHLDNTFDFAAEVRVTWGVDQIDFHTAVVNRDVLRQNGDSAFFFDVVRIEDPFSFEFRIAILSTLPQQTIHQCGFPVVNVSDDDDISDLISNGGIARGIGAGVLRRGCGGRQRTAFNG